MSVIPLPVLMLPSAHPLPADDVMSAFGEACLEGKAGFSEEQARGVGFLKLPATARSKLNLSWRPHYHKGQGKEFKRAYAQYHQLSGYSGKNYVAVEERITSRGAKRRVCALVTSRANIVDAVTYLDPDLSTVTSKKSQEIFIDEKSENWFQITGEGQFLSVHNLPGKYTLVQTVKIENEGSGLSSAEKLALENANRRHDLWLSIFKSACTEGRVRLDPEQAQPVKWKALPRPFRNWYKGVRKQSSFYQIRTTPPGYLVFFENKQAKGYDYLRGCAVAGMNFDLDYANAVIRGSKNPNTRTTYPDGQVFESAGFRHTSPDFDYVIRGDTVLGPYKVVQLSFVSDKQRQDLIEEKEKARVELEEFNEKRRSAK